MVKGISLNFQHCSCGCARFQAGSKGISFTIYKHEGDDLYYLHLGHTYGSELGSFKYFVEASRAAEEYWDKLP